MHGDVLRYRSRTRGLSKAGAPSDGWYERTMTLYFAPGRFVGGTGASTAGRPSRTSTRCAAPGVKPRRSRHASPRRRRRRARRRLEPRPLRLCRQLGVRGDIRRGPARVLVEFLGREPIVAKGRGGCPLRLRLRAPEPPRRGEEAFWEVDDLAPIRRTSWRLTAPCSGAERLSAVRSRGQGGRRLVAVPARADAGDQRLLAGAGR